MILNRQAGNFPPIQQITGKWISSCVRRAGNALKNRWTGPAADEESRGERSHGFGARLLQEGSATMDAVKPTIFIVEDDPDISRLVRHHLEAAGFTARLYSTGNLVVLDAERQRPALFLLDIMVPGKDGLELCRQIRQSITLASVPVIFLTAKSGEADRVLGLELG